MIREIDPKTLRKAAPRPEPIKEQPVLRLVDFDGQDTFTGKVSEITEGKFSVFTERMNAGSVSATMVHPSKSRVISVLLGELNVEQNEQTTVVKEGHSVEIGANVVYKFSTNSICVFSSVAEANYQKRLNVDDSTKVAGSVSAVYKAAPVSRYKSKAREQLALLNPQDEKFVPTAAPQNPDVGLNDMPQTFDGGF